MAEKAIDNTENVSKRLIISGLTPAIDANSLSQRLASFGTVHSLQGVGMLDANGAPRKFAHLTLETTPAKLRRCMQAFSGSTWKGAKLRLGEAKPDFNERKRPHEGIEDNGPPSKRVKTAKEEKLEKKLKLRAKKSLRPRHHGDMSLVTRDHPELKQKLWKSTLDGRLLRAMRMRPLHPIPIPVVPRASKTTAAPKNLFRPNKSSIKGAAPKKKALVPLKRARATVIDPTRYGTTHISLTMKSKRPAEGDGRWEYDEQNHRWVRAPESGQILATEDVRMPILGLNNVQPSIALSVPSAPQSTSDFPSPTSLVHPSTNISSPKTSYQPPSVATMTTPHPAHSSSKASGSDEIAHQLAGEKAQGLAIMQRLLSGGWAVDLNELESGGKDVGEDENVNDKIVVRHASPIDGEAEQSESDGDLEVSDNELEDDESEDDGGDDGEDDPAASSPLGHAEEPMSTLSADAADEAEESYIAQTVFDDASSTSESDDEVEASAPIVESSPGEPAAALSSAAPAQGPKSLKDMFAPREEEGGFSLFGNLASSGFELDDIEFDSDAEVEGPPVATSGAIGHSIIVEEPSVPSTAMRAFISRDESITFDPSIPLFFPVPPRLRDSSKSAYGKKGAKPRDIFDVAKEKGWEGGFYRTATEEEIRKRWEELRGDLTRQYKRRHREASKKRRRGHGTTIAEREAI
ncbi:hypothetical protein DL93DRAFT_744804 [Clavulina sp. PMI_390]|nr:hypothetical protein DL93DRAFT_744804 [Clavulina sp. PMI_390]